MMSTLNPRKQTSLWFDWINQRMVRKWDNRPTHTARIRPKLSKLMYVRRCLVATRVRANLGASERRSQRRRRAPPPTPPFHKPPNVFSYHSLPLEPELTEPEANLKLGSPARQLGSSARIGSARLGSDRPGSADELARRSLTKVRLHLVVLASVVRAVRLAREAALLVFFSLDSSLCSFSR